MPRHHADWRESIQVRPVRPRDAPAIAEFFCHLSHDTVYYRYFSANRPSAEAACRLAQCDHRNSEVIVAEAANGSIIGVIDCYRHGEGHAEVGIVVADAYQSRGIGARLLRAAVDVLEAEGVVLLDGDFLMENQRMRCWMRHLGADLKFDAGTVHFDLHLNPEEQTLPRAA